MTTVLKIQCTFPFHAEGYGTQSAAQQQQTWTTERDNRTAAGQMHVADIETDAETQGETLEMQETQRDSERGSERRERKYHVLLQLNAP